MMNLGKIIDDEEKKCRWIFGKKPQWLIRWQLRREIIKEEIRDAKTRAWARIALWDCWK